jgi:hypothetical protein
MKLIGLFLLGVVLSAIEAVVLAWCAADVWRLYLRLEGPTFQQWMGIAFLCQIILPSARRATALATSVGWKARAVIVTYNIGGAAVLTWAVSRCVFWLIW